MIRYLADADVNHAIVRGCRRLEPAIDFRTAQEAGLDGLSDLDVLAAAASEERILVTNDRRTMPAHLATYLMTCGSHPGVLALRKFARIGLVIDELVLIWGASEPDEWRDRVVVVPRR